MAEPATLGFRPGRSIPHRLDARFKLVSLAMVNIVTLRADFPSLAALTAILLAAIGHMGVPFRSMAREMRYFAFLLLLVFAARTISTPGATLISAAGMTVTREGLAAGGWSAGDSPASFSPASSSSPRPVRRRSAAP